MKDQLSLWLAAAWWASLSLLGLVVVPLLFVHLPTPAMAGAMAAHLFSAQTLLSCGCAGVLLVLHRPRRHAQALVSLPPTFAWVALTAGLGLLCAALAEWVVAPHIIARDDLQFWHRLGSAAYLLQWLLALATFQLLVRRRAADCAAERV